MSLPVLRVTEHGRCLLAFVSVRRALSDCEFISIDEVIHQY
jgi:hypothetical protein